MPDTSRSSAERDELAEFIADLQFVMPNFNDTFSYATADTEKLSVGDGLILADFWREYGWHGLVAIAALHRKADPIPPVMNERKYQEALTALRESGLAEEFDD